MRISDLLIKDRINLDVQANDKPSLIRELAKLHEKTGVLNDYEGYVEALEAREAQSSTGIGEGIAIPHAKTKYVKEPALAMGRKMSGIDYQSLDGDPATLFFMIAAPDGANNTHIETLARLSQLLLDDDFKAALEKAPTADAVLDIINKTEAEKFPDESKKEEVKEEPVANSTSSGDEPYIIAATACPTGIAHTYMAAAALKKAAEEMGVKIKVETNGADGRKDILTSDDIKKAKGVILAINRNIEVDRFDGKPLIQVEAKEGINNAKELIQKVLDGKAPIFHASGSSKASSGEEASSDKKGLYKHLLSGVSYMLPLVISGGILIALAFLVDTLAGNANVGGGFGTTAPLAKLLMTIGKSAFGLFLPILGGYIAFSISERAALTSGLVAGLLATELPYLLMGVESKKIPPTPGFIGALIGGFLAGVVVKLLIKVLSGLPRSLNGLKMILLYPVLSVLITGTIMWVVVNPIATFINVWLNNGLSSMQGASAILLGAILGGMMSVDMGGPINKVAYVFGTGTLTAATMTSGGTFSMAAVMAGGMVPPIAIALASTIFKNKFTEQEREAGLTNYIMGFSFITEGAIPYAAADPTRVIPASVVGSAVAGALIGLFRVKIPAPHGGILVMGLSKTANGGNGFFLYLFAVIIGAIVSAILLGLLKKKVDEK
nr:fructose-specific PTS transporter subunit EIIC [uncultured Leptotrichia sp.]